jgi:hypothetical protein
MLCLQSDLYDYQQGLAAERQALTTERGKQARLGKSITEQMNLEAQVQEIICVSFA